MRYRCDTDEMLMRCLPPRLARPDARHARHARHEPKPKSISQEGPTKSQPLLISALRPHSPGNPQVTPARRSLSLPACGGDLQSIKYRPGPGPGRRELQIDRILIRILIEIGPDLAQAARELEIDRFLIRILIEIGPDLAQAARELQIDRILIRILINIGPDLAQAAGSSKLIEF